MYSEKKAVDEIIDFELETIVLPLLSDYDDRVFYHQLVIGSGYSETKKFYQVYGSESLHVLKCGIVVQSTMIDMKAMVSFEVVDRRDAVDDIPF